MGLLNGILNIWCKIQNSKISFTYGYKRFEVLAIFSSAILIILGSFFIIKEGFECFFEENEVYSNQLLPAAILGFLFHIFITLGVKNDSFDYVIRSSSTSWLQEHAFDISESTCRVIPGLSKILLPRANPLLLLGLLDFIIVIGTYFFMQIGSSYLIDVYSAFFIAFTTIGTMFPFAVFTGKILLQTTPSHLITQLDKILREASTLDGVLEFRDEHFWTISFGVLAGSLHVRIRRDADEQLVLAHVWNKLAGVVHHLTIHIFKDDWIRRTTHQLVYNQANLSIPSPTFPILNYSKQNINPLLNEEKNSPANLNSNSKNVVVENDFVIVNP